MLRMRASAPAFFLTSATRTDIEDPPSSPPCHPTGIASRRAPAQVQPADEPPRPASDRRPHRGTCISWQAIRERTSPDGFAKGRCSACCRRNRLTARAAAICGGPHRNRGFNGDNWHRDGQAWREDIRGHLHARARNGSRQDSHGNSVSRARGQQCGTNCATC